jgi:hypothetical protein
MKRLLFRCWLFQCCIAKSLNCIQFHETGKKCPYPWFHDQKTVIVETWVTDSWISERYMSHTISESVAWSSFQGSPWVRNKVLIASHFIRCQPCMYSGLIIGSFSQQTLRGHPVNRWLASAELENFFNQRWDQIHESAICGSKFFKRVNWKRKVTAQNILYRVSDSS